MAKKIIAVALALAMCLALIPGYAFAGDELEAACDSAEGVVGEGIEAVAEVPDIVEVPEGAGDGAEDAQTDGDARDAEGVGPYEDADETGEAAIPGGAEDAADDGAGERAAEGVGPYGADDNSQNDPNDDPDPADEVIVAAAEVSDLAVFEAGKHTVTVVYEMPEGCETPAPAPYSFTGETGEAYVVSSPAVEGFAPDRHMVYGTVGNKDETITVHYAAIVYVVYVEYKVPEGYTAPKSQHKTGSPGTKYSFATPALSGLTPDRELVQGEIGAKDETITVTYYADVYTVLVKYAVPQGFAAPPDGRAMGVPGTRYSIESPQVAGLIPDKAKVEGSIGSADAVVNVAYSLEDHSVTMRYEVPEGYTAPEPVTVTDKIGTAFRVESPKIDGLAPSTTAVNGTIDFEDHTVTVSYSDEQYTVYVQYAVPAGYEDKLPKQRAKTGLPTEEYSFPSPVIAGLTPDQSVVSGHIGNLTRTILVTYTETTYEAEVVYKVPEGYVAPATRRQNGLRPGDSYSFQSPDLSADGLALKDDGQELVSGRIADADVSVTVEYMEMEHFVAVDYVVPQGFTAPETRIVWGLRGAEYSILSPSVAGLKPDQGMVSGIFGRESQIFTVTYTVSPGDDLCPNPSQYSVSELGGHHNLVTGWADDDHEIHRLEFGDGWETVSYTNNAVYCIDCGQIILNYRSYSSGREHYCSFPHGGGHRVCYRFRGLSYL